LERIQRLEIDLQLELIQRLAGEGSHNSTQPNPAMCHWNNVHAHPTWLVYSSQLHSKGGPSHSICLI